MKGSQDLAVIELEKLPWTCEDVAGALSGETGARQEFNNDIYGQYGLSVRPEFNRVKCNMINPASEEHIQKYLSSPVHLVLETPELYQAITLPHIKSHQISCQWIYNVLESFGRQPTGRAPGGWR